MNLTHEAGRTRLDMTGHLTDEQVLALVHDREVAVGAGAGAGKTTTLAARFVTLLHTLIQRGTSPPDVQSVLVLTFTDRAAQEMRDRCYKTVCRVATAYVESHDALCAAGVPDRTLRRERQAWEWIRDRFSGTAIGTFHGFCLRTLAEFPAESGTTPGARTLEADEASGWAFEAAAAAVDGRLAEPDAEVGLLLRTTGGRNALIGTVARLVEDRAECSDVLRVHAGGRLITANLVEASPVAATVARTWLCESFAPFAKSLLALVGDARTPTLDALRGLVSRDTEALTDLDAFAAYQEALAALRSRDRFRRLNNAATTGTAAQRGRAWTTAEKGRLTDLQEELDSWEPLVESATEVPTGHDATLLRVLAALAPLGLDAIDRHQERLRAEQALDFTELQLRVAAALRDPATGILGALRARHRYLMVDEFQDTDALQWEIVSSLARPPGATTDRLFFVGDDKQAIYGFRGGDVEVFAAARESVARGGGALVELTRNHRSRVELVAAFNTLFAPILGPPSPRRPPWEASFAPISAGRVEGPTRSPAFGGTVRIGWHDHSVPAVGAEAEATWIARLLATEILPGVGAFGNLAACEADAAPGVAILFRARTHLGAFETALRAAGIPYLCGGGLGFWGRPEIADILNLLDALARGDAISRVGALRSPLFGLSDDSLYHLATLGALHGFGEGPLAPDACSDPSVASAQRLWTGLLDDREVLPVAGLIERILEQFHQSWAQGLAAPGGRGAANLERLLALADAHDATGGSLESFVSRARRQRDEGAKAAEAPPRNTRARVTLLTVHASKGLEFPVVVVPGLDNPPRGSSTGVLRQRDGAGFALATKVPALQAATEHLVAPGVLNRLRRLESARGEAEARRLLYVACTRARDHLVLAGRLPARPAERTAWAGWIATALETGAASGAGMPPGVTAVTIPPQSADGPVCLPPTTARGPAADLARWLAPVDLPSEVVLSPSHLDNHDGEPFSLVGSPHPRATGAPAVLPGVTGSAAVRGGGKTPSLSIAASALRGEVLHTLLEDDAVDDLALARTRWLAAARESGLAEVEVAAGLEEVRAHLDAIGSSAEARAILGSRGFRELPVSLTRGRVRLGGRIDLLSRDPWDGAWAVVDYKSTRSDVDDTTLVGMYRTQLLAYSVAATAVLERNGEPSVRRGILVLTATGRVLRLPDWTRADFAEVEGAMDRYAAPASSP